jgi:hypothetical protein
MTFPAKENLIYFEELEKNQTRLWDDAADMGIALNSTFGDRNVYDNGPTLKDAARDNLLALMETYAYKLERYGNGCSSTTLFIPFEFDEGAYVGTEINVTFDKIGCREYLTIFTQRARRTHAEAMKNGNLFKMTPKRREMPKPEDEYTAAYEAAYEDEYTAAYEARRF